MPFPHLILVIICLCLSTYLFNTETAKVERANCDWGEVTKQSESSKEIKVLKFRSERAQEETHIHYLTILTDVKKN